MVTTHDVLKKIAYQLEAISISVSALESAATSNELGGRQLTETQLSDLKKQALTEQREIFAELKGMISALDPTL